MVKPSSELEVAALDLLKERGVKIEEIAELVYDLQTPYLPNLTMEVCIDNVRAVLRKREIQNAVLTGIELDMLAEKKQLSSPLQEIIENDEGLFGIDEILALAIVNVYGSIGLTNFGFISENEQLKRWNLDNVHNSIVVNQKMETNIPGIYAAGDVTTFDGKVKLIATGFGEAPTAVNSIIQYLNPNQVIQAPTQSAEYGVDKFEQHFKS